ncbi:saccharopine dehydrogenase family protein [Bacteroidota bacterium]
MKIMVLGAGLVGRPMALDLAKNNEFDVSIADINEKNLNQIPASSGINKLVKDLSDKKTVTDTIKKADIILNAVPGHMGFAALKTIIESGKNVVDIAFLPEDPFKLDKLAKDHNVTAIVDCGVAPGMSNVLAGYVNTILDKTENILIYVGGLPEVREWPYDYKAVFSPIDVIEEYTRPARYVENGKIIVKPALSDPEFINFPGIGTLEAFNSDGLRSLADTLNVPNMKEKTLRYPGHIEKMLLLRESGFFNYDEVDIKGTKVRPIDLTSKLLFPCWEMKEGDIDFTVMKVIVEGMKDGKKVKYTYDLFDRFDESTNVHSMARTTGYTATMAVRMLANKLFDQKGIVPPEYIGKNKKCVDFILKGLKERGIVYHETVETLD